MSGFPEWLPEQQMVENHLLQLIREEFELHGFVQLRTRSVERLEDLLLQGETDKEIYAVQRIGAPADDADARLGLHYDLTVPFARFVAENAGSLTFPFRRYQIQPAWRGERPQLGRYREFVQADADIIVQGRLDVRYDAEMIALLQRIVGKLPVPRVRLLVNNRKLLEGYYRGLGIADVTSTLRIIDKLAKIGAKKTIDLLVGANLSSAQAEACVALAQVEAKTVEELERLKVGRATDLLFEEGIAELSAVLSHCARSGLQEAVEVVAALHIARGFDYYTGTVVEGVFADHADLGAVCSGGRYDNLASGSAARLPGVGISIGVTRMLAYCFHLGLLKQLRKTPAVVLVAVHSQDSRPLSDQVAAVLRRRGIPCMVSDSSDAYGKQLKFADRCGILHVWFPAFGDRPHEVKNIASGEQAPADPETWTPGADCQSLRFS